MTRHSILKVSLCHLLLITTLSCRPVQPSGSPSSISPIGPIWILTVGDSNGASTQQQAKWPDTLSQCLGGTYRIINHSESGRTIGFDNLGRESLNTLKQVSSILNDACVQTDGKGGFDRVLILLGTNDCKAVFDDRQSQVTPNLEKLIRAIRDFDYPNHQVPRITVISPPPYGRKAAVTAKYKDADKRAKALLPQFRRLARQLDCDFIDIHTPLQPDIEQLTVDGVHFTDKGYTLMGKLIADALIRNQG